MNTTSEKNESLAELETDIAQRIAEHKQWYMIQGIVFIVAGILAIIIPAATAVGFGIVIGALLLVSGIIQGVASFRSGLHWWSLLSALLSIVVGVLMLVNPVVGAVALATILAIFLLLEGITEIFLAFQFRSVRNWGWLAFSGVVSLVLALIVFAGWPGTSIVLLGVIIGVNFVLYGTSLLALTRSVD